MLMLELIVLASSAGIASAHACQRFQSKLSIPHSQIISVSHHAHGEHIQLPGLVDSCATTSGTFANATTDLCRVVLTVPTSNSSSVQMETWLPDSWNGRFLATGNGGIGGCIDYATIQNAVHLGFASMGTNAGHNGSSGYDFFLNKPEVVNDFGYRALHVEAQTGKKIIEQYYGQSAKKNYYAGCSTGGRQGLQVASSHPDDFDGILAGSPGVNWLYVVASKGIIAHRIGWPNLDSPEYVRPEQWTAIVAEQIRQLDPLDGVTDGIIDQPAEFRFDPETLSCGYGVLNGSLCLTAAQIKSVRAAYDPIANSKGKIVYPGWDAGASTSVFSDNQKDGKPELSYTTLEDFWRGAVVNSTTWTPLNFSTADMDAAIEVNPGRVLTSDTNLSAFHARGGKVLHYHGRSDNSVASGNSEAWFTSVQESVDLTLSEMSKFYRLFFIPGMRHCTGGPGAWSIGNANLYPWDHSKEDPEHNALLALVDWVEKDQPPDSIIGTKYQGDRIGSGTVLAERRHCPYPLTSKWNGKGKTTEAQSWRCVAAGT